MGPSHALSGAAAWLAGSLAVQHFAHYHQTPVQLAVGTAMCAGGALLPDLDLSGRVCTDQGGATVAHTFGVVSLFVAECVEKLSLGVYDLTRTRKDPRLRNGHRTFTHTLPFNLGVGFGVFELCRHFGKGAVLGVLFVTFAMALRGLFEDMVTSHGCPVLWPIPVGRRMWRCIGVPDAVAVKVGGKMEVFVLRTAFALVAVAAGTRLLVRPFLHRYDIEV